MVSTTSGTNTFNLDIDEIIEQALDPIGGEITSGDEARKARVKLNLILIELQNKNIPLSKLDTISLTITEDTSQYSLDSSVIDILEMSIKKNTDDFYIPIERWGVRDFQQIPNKSTKERPTIWSTERLRDNVDLNLWPIPNGSYTGNLLVSKRVEDITASYQKIDLSYRYLPLLVKWLSYEMAISRPNIDKDLIVMLKNRRDEVMPDSFDEDRERVNQKVVIGGISGT